MPIDSEKVEQVVQRHWRAIVRRATSLGLPLPIITDPGHSVVLNQKYAQVVVEAI